MSSRTNSALLFLQRKKREITKSLTFICSRKKEQVPNSEKVNVLKSNSGRWVGRRGNDPTRLIFLYPLCSPATQNPSAVHLGQDKLRGNFVHIPVELMEESK